MFTRLDRKQSRVKTRRRIRGRVSGTTERPRLSVFRSLNHTYVQAIDDLSGSSLPLHRSMQSAARSCRRAEIWTLQRSWVRQSQHGCWPRASPPRCSIAEDSDITVESKHWRTRRVKPVSSSEQLRR